MHLARLIGLPRPLGPPRRIGVELLVGLPKLELDFNDLKPIGLLQSMVDGVLRLFLTLSWFKLRADQFEVKIPVVFGVGVSGFAKDGVLGASELGVICSLKMFRAFGE